MACARYRGLILDLDNNTAGIQLNFGSSLLRHLNETSKGKPNASDFWPLSNDRLNRQQTLVFPSIPHSVPLLLYNASHCNRYLSVEICLKFHSDITRVRLKSHAWKQWPTQVIAKFNFRTWYISVPTRSAKGGLSSLKKRGWI